MIMWGLLVFLGLMEGFKLAYLIGLSLILVALLLEHTAGQKTCPSISIACLFSPQCLDQPHFSCGDGG